MAIEGDPWVQAELTEEVAALFDLVLAVHDQRLHVRLRELAVELGGAEPDGEQRSGDCTCGGASVPLDVRHDARVLERAYGAGVDGTLCAAPFEYEALIGMIRVAAG